MYSATVRGDVESVDPWDTMVLEMDLYEFLTSY
jgi:hypothetical protein